MKDKAEIIAYITSLKLDDEFRHILVEAVKAAPAVDANLFALLQRAFELQAEAYEGQADMLREELQQYQQALQALDEIDEPTASQAAQP